MEELNMVEQKKYNVKVGTYYIKATLEDIEPLAEAARAYWRKHYILEEVRQDMPMIPEEWFLGYALYDTIIIYDERSRIFSLTPECLNVEELYQEFVEKYGMDFFMDDVVSLLKCREITSLSQLEEEFYMFIGEEKFLQYLKRLPFKCEDEIRKRLLEDFTNGNLEKKRECIVQYTSCCDIDWSNIMPCDESNFIYFVKK
jgi:hypothetical protein